MMGLGEGGGGVGRRICMYIIGTYEREGGKENMYVYIGT